MCRDRARRFRLRAVVPLVTDRRGDLEHVATRRLFDRSLTDHLVANREFCLNVN